MADLMELKDEIKATVTMEDLADRLGLGPIRQGKIRSIYKDEKTPSLHLYKYDFFDFATGQGGDQIRFVMDARGCSFRQAVSWISGGADELAPRRKQEEKKKAVNLEPLWGLINDQPTVRTIRHAEQYVAGKWPTLTLEDVLAFGSKLAANGDLLTPHYNMDAVMVGIKVRNLWYGTKRSVSGSTFREALYQPKWIPLADRLAPGIRNIRQAWLVEGESDCWALSKYDSESDVYALPSGAGLWRDKWRKQLAAYDSILVVMDNDEAGLDARERITGSLASMAPRRHVLNVYVPNDFNDVAMALAGGWTP